MLVSVGSILALVVFCLYRVSRLPPVEVEDLQSPLKIDIGDIEDRD
jgi:hypothetical protein